MKRFWFACLAAGTLLGAASLARADSSGPVRVETEPFVTLPDGVRHPEGLASDPATGAVYVATFDFGPNTNKLLRYSRNGQLEASKDFGATPLLGLDFAGGKLYILNMGASRVQRIAAAFTASTPVEDVAQIPVLATGAGTRTGGVSATITYGPASPAPNAMVFDRSGNLYVSDSWQGAIFRIANATACAMPCAATTFKQDALLATAGFPPFGANGLAFNADETVMYVANTGDDRVLAMNMADRGLSVFAESINGADGLLFTGGLLWVCANQSDTVLALNANGRPVVHAGEFLGIAPNGAPRGLLFPASLAQVGDWMYVTNLALALTGVPGAEPEGDVTRWTVSRFHIPH
ncbi:MAG TPA: SMP-30/gluconolactonase/LRE family protein [Usitatibacter sp.]|jgi:sugar lactone lactonase YvrE|nr:SMP-30/gluconolactonase/LRE family protein [Usitatibacter sp.]